MNAHVEQQQRLRLRRRTWAALGAVVLLAAAATVVTASYARLADASADADAEEATLAFQLSVDDTLKALRAARPSAPVRLEYEHLDTLVGTVADDDDTKPSDLVNH